MLRLIQSSAHLRILGLSAGLIVTAFLCGCGIKPSQVSPPEGYENSKFPHTYPNPNTDPS